MHFDLIDLKLFVNIAEAGSITGGAARSHLALASASARVQGLEDALGTPLLVRGRRGATPTEAGYALLHHARGLLQRAQQLRADLRDHARGARGRVQLLCNTVALTEFLPQALARFLAGHPQVDVDLEERPSHAIARAIGEGQAELGIASDAVDLGGLQTRLFRHDRLVLAVPAGHRLAGLPGLRLAQALDCDFVGLAARNALTIYLENYAAHSLQHMRVRLRLPDFDAALRAVAAGGGAAVVPRTAAMRQPRGRIGVVPLSDPWATRRLLLCMRDYDALPAYGRALVQALQQPDQAGPAGRASRHRPAA